MCLITIAGIPGSGKSTQVEILARRLGSRVAVLSAPMLLRTTALHGHLTSEETRVLSESKHDADLSRRKGTLAPLAVDQVLFQLAIRLERQTDYVVLDGAPRGLSQAKLLLSLLNTSEVASYGVIHLQPPAPIILRSFYRQIHRSVQTKGWPNTVRNLHRFYTKAMVYQSDTSRGLQFLRANGVSVRDIYAWRTRDEVAAEVEEFMLISKHSDKTYAACAKD